MRERKMGGAGRGWEIDSEERKEKAVSIFFFFFFYIMHEQGGTSRRTKQDQINRRTEALMMWHKCDTKPAGKTCSLSFCLPSHRGIMT